MSSSIRTEAKNPQKLMRTPVSTAVHAATTAMLIGATLPNIASAQIEEIVVTASKRAESMQDVPVSVIALDSQTIADVGITNFDDYVRHQPNLTASGRGPGNTTYYIRGMSTGQMTVSAVEAAGNSPSVALYLDEQPIQTIGRNIDVYIADMDRIEVLAGPQGTLFGASSQAGTVRLITKKPVLNEFQAGGKTSISDTHDGEMSTSVEGYINIPLIEDKLAWRSVVYSSNQGGFIDNVLGSEDPLAINPQVKVRFPDAVTIPATNTTTAEENFNDADYQGYRSSLNFQANDKWDFLLQVMQQELNVKGTMAMNPTVGDLDITTFFPDFQNSEFSQLAWTANGQIGNLDLIYTGAFLNREVDQSLSDNSYLEAGRFVVGYLCNPVECYDPVYGVRFTVETERQTHEFRVATPADNRLRFIGGVFFDNADLGSTTDFTSPAQVQNGVTAQQIPFPGATNFNPNPRAPGVNFVNDITRWEKQMAVFGEVAYEVIPDTLTATIGARFYEQEVGLAGSTNLFYEAVPSAWNGFVSANGDTGYNIDASLDGISPGTEDDTVMKFNVSWTPDDDKLFYATYSEGFRPGGFNRRGGPSPINPDIFLPYAYTTDTVENIEFGWKVTGLDGRFRWNGTYYKVDWSDLQLAVQDFNVSNLSFTTNLGSAEVSGIDSDLVFAATDNLTLFASFAWNDSEITSISNDLFAPSNIEPIGSSLAFSPKFQYNLRGRFTWEAGSYDAHAQLGLQHADESKNSNVVSNLATIPKYNSWDATIGFSKENYGVELFVDNISDERIIRFLRVSGSTPQQFVTRPRSIGLRFRYDY